MDIPLLPKVHGLAWNRLKNYIPTDFPYGTEKYFSLER